MSTWDEQHQHVEAATRKIREHLNTALGNPEDLYQLSWLLTDLEKLVDAWLDEDMGAGLGTLREWAHG